MEANYVQLDGTQTYVNEDQICLAIEYPADPTYTVITMSCGERLIVKPAK